MPFYFGSSLADESVKQMDYPVFYLILVSFPFNLFHSFVILRIWFFCILKLEMSAQWINVTISFHDKYV